MKLRIPLTTAAILASAAARPASAQKVFGETGPRTTPGQGYVSMAGLVTITPAHRMPIGLAIEAEAGRVGHSVRPAFFAQLGWRDLSALRGLVGLRCAIPASDVGHEWVAGAGYAFRSRGGPGIVGEFALDRWDFADDYVFRAEATVPLDRSRSDELQLRWPWLLQEVSLLAGVSRDLTADGGDEDEYDGDDDDEGRPLRHGDDKVLPMAVPLAPLSRTAAHWLRRARTEHASVPAFEQLAAELAALGAPRRLVGRALQAAREEAGHARLCYAQVARRTGAPVLVGPTPRWSIRGGDRRTRLDRMLHEALRDGIIGEGDAATRAAGRRDAARDDAVARVEHTIVTEESGHATLAEDVFAWARREGGRLAS